MKKILEKEALIWTLIGVNTVMTLAILVLNVSASVQNNYRSKLKEEQAIESTEEANKNSTGVATGNAVAKEDKEENNDDKVEYNLGVGAIDEDTVAKIGGGAGDLEVAKEAQELTREDFSILGLELEDIFKYIRDGVNVALYDDSGRLYGRNNSVFYNKIGHMEDAKTTRGIGLADTMISVIRAYGVNGELYQLTGRAREIWSTPDKDDAECMLEYVYNGDEKYIAAIRFILDDKYSVIAIDYLCIERSQE